MGQGNAAQPYAARTRTDGRLEAGPHRSAEILPRFAPHPDGLREALPQGRAAPLWFMDESVHRTGLQIHAPKTHTKGQNIIQRHRLPIQTIVGLGRVQNACNFIGKRSIVGSREPIVVVKAMTAQRVLSAAIVT